MQKPIAYIVLVAWLLIVTVPLVWVVANSLRSTQEVFENPFGVPWIIAGGPGDQDENAALRNYSRAWVDSGFSRYFVNSVIVTGAALAGILATAAMASYVLARFHFAGHRALYYFFISGMMIPAQLVLIPLFFQYSEMGELLTALTRPFGYEVQFHNSLSGLTLIYIALSLPFTILVLTGFFRSLPGSLRESALLDGASEWQVFRHIMLPLARPGLVTAAIFNFIGLWNEYLFALVFINDPLKKTLPLGLAGVSIQAQYKTDFGLMFAGLVIVLIPTLIVYIALQRQLTSGITTGALKG